MLQKGRDGRFRGVLATFKVGYIGRMTTYGRQASGFDQRHLIQHSASVSKGTSGSAMFTSDGTVVAVNNGGQMIQTPQGVRPSPSEIAFAIRADELSDLLRESGW